MKIRTRTFLLAVMLVVTGCASEVDKCVEDNMQSWSERQDRIRSGEKIPVWNGYAVLDKETPTEMRAMWRTACLELYGKSK